MLSQGHAADVFEAYSQLLTEMVLRLPYQIKKIADTNPRIPPPIFDHSWFYFLSEVEQFFLLSYLLAYWNTLWCVYFCVDFIVIHLFCPIYL